MKLLPTEAAVAVVVVRSFAVCRRALSNVLQCDNAANPTAAEREDNFLNSFQISCRICLRLLLFKRKTNHFIIVFRGVLLCYNAISMAGPGLVEPNQS